MEKINANEGYVIVSPIRVAPRQEQLVANFDAPRGVAAAEPGLQDANEFGEDWRFGRATIVAVGPKLPTKFTAGAVIMYDRRYGMSLKLNGEILVALRGPEVFGVVETVVEADAAIA